MIFGPLTVLLILASKFLNSTQFNLDFSDRSVVSTLFTEEEKQRQQIERKTTKDYSDSIQKLGIVERLRNFGYSRC
jgi:hypothetical protein